MYGGVNIPQRHPVNVRQHKNSRNRGPYSRFGGDGKASSCALRGELEKGNPKADLAGGAAGKKRIRNLLYLFRRHAAAIVINDYRETVTGKIRLNGDSHQGRSGSGGILRYIQYIQRNFCHHSLFILCQDPRNVVWSQSAIYLIVDHHDRSQTAGTDTAAGIQ